MATAVCLFLATWTISHAISYQGRKEDFSLIQQYQLTNIEIINDPIPSIKFNAFSTDFTVALTANPDLIPSDIRHTNGNPTIMEGNEQYFTHKNTSCHYFGEILDTNDKSTASISLCDKRGVRGQIHYKNDTIIIKPAAYFLNPAQEYHSFDDQHMVYKLSDVALPPFVYGDEIKLPSHSESLPNPSNMHKLLNRRRLAYNKGHSKVEVLIFLEATIQQYYKDNFNNWYEAMVNDMTDLINGVSDIWYAQNWGSDIGKISVKLVELELIMEWNGDYTSMKPQQPECSDLKTPKKCPIDGAKWVSQTATWINKYKDTSTFDVAMSIHQLKLWDRTGQNRKIVGWGSIGSVCQRGDANSNTYMIYTPDYLLKTLAHELGHNFGSGHDVGQKSGCGPNDGLMGYGTFKPMTFSKCSVADVQDYYKNNNGLTCLSNNFGEFKSNYNPSTPQPDKSGNTASSTTTKSPSWLETWLGSGSGSGSGGTGTACTEHVSCLKVRSLRALSDGTDFDGEWQDQGCFNGHSQYKRTINGKVWYFYRNTKDDRWTFGDILDAHPGVGYCDSGKDNILTCTDFTMWKAATSKWKLDPDARFEDCSPSKLRSNEKIEDCFPKREYNEKVCVHNQNNHTLWMGHREFSILEGVCSFDKAVYFYTDKDESGDSETIYYLHYDEYYKYSDDTVTRSRWIISKHGISTDGEAFCNKEELMECGHDSWLIDEAKQDYIEHGINDGMSIYNRECPVEVAVSHHVNVLINQHYFFGAVVLILIIITIINARCLGCKMVKAEKIKEALMRRKEEEVFLSDTPYLSDTTDMENLTV